MTRSILIPVLLIALTDVTLQLDNALAISSVASAVPPSQRYVVLGLGVLLAAACLFLFTLVGSNVIERVAWLKPVAAVALIAIGGQLLWSWFRG